MWSSVMFGVLAVVVVAEAWPSMYDTEFKRWSLSRRSYCKESYGKCYSTSDCCKGYVCAAVDEEGKGGLNPTTPGWCVHEKSLDPCVSNLDCDEGKCVPLGNHRYCVKTRPRAMALAGEGDTVMDYKPKGGLGSRCEDDSDCNNYHKDGMTSLCCQWVRQGRNGKQKKCDRVTPISTCIRNKK